MMALAIKCVHNLPPHFSYVSTLPDITQKLKQDTDVLKLGTIFLTAALTKPLTSGKHGCMHV